MTTKNDVAKLMSEAQQQLDEHKVWLKEQLLMAPGLGPEIANLIDQVDNIKLRMSRIDPDNITIVWEYPDEVVTFLKAETTPEHLRKALEGGHLIDPGQPGHSAKRAP